MTFSRIQTALLLVAFFAWGGIAARRLLPVPTVPPRSIPAGPVPSCGGPCPRGDRDCPAGCSCSFSADPPRCGSDAEVAPSGSVPAEHSDAVATGGVPLDPDHAGTWSVRPTWHGAVPTERALLRALVARRSALAPRVSP